MEFHLKVHRGLHCEPGFLRSASLGALPQTPGVLTSLLPSECWTHSNG
jgi:hypothetical protein